MWTAQLANRSYTPTLGKCVETLFWHSTALGSGEMEMFTTLAEVAPKASIYSTESSMVSVLKLLLQCLYTCHHMVLVSIYCHWSTCPMRKAEGTKIIRLEKRRFGGDRIAVCQYMQGDNYEKRKPSSFPWCTGKDWEIMVINYVY